MTERKPNSRFSIKLLIPSGFLIPVGLPRTLYNISQSFHISARCSLVKDSPTDINFPAQGYARTSARCCQFAPVSDRWKSSHTWSLQQRWSRSRMGAILNGTKEMKCLMHIFDDYVFSYSTCFLSIK